MKKDSLIISILATILALTLVLAMLPGVFLIPALFAACCFGYKRYGYLISFVASLMFGVIALIYSFIPFGLFFTTLKPYFQNYPWVPIVPRLFIGPVATTVFMLMSKIMGEGEKAKNSKVRKILPIALAGAMGSLTNTVLVGISLHIVDSALGAGYYGLALIDLVTWGSIEIAFAVVLLPPLVLTVQKAVPDLMARLEYTQKQEIDENQEPDENQKTEEI